MNALKNFEAVFVVAVALSFSAAAIAEQPKARAAKPAATVKASKPADSQVITVVVPGKRLSKAEKAQLAAL